MEATIGQVKAVNEKPFCHHETKEDAFVRGKDKAKKNAATQKGGGA
jgi:hypothetical protein